MINKFKVGSWIVWLNISYFIIYNTIFGWNKYPINETEKMCDDVFSWGMKIALLFFFMPIIDWYYIWVKDFYKRQRGEGN